MNAELNRIEDFSANKTVNGFYLVREKHLRKKQNGEPYLSVVLTDKTGSISGNIWDSIREIEPLFEKGDPVAMKGIVKEWQDSLQVTIQYIKKASDAILQSYNQSIVDLLPATSKSIDSMWEEIQSIIQSIDEPFSSLVSAIFAEHEEKIKSYPASMKLHHAVYGGLLEHVSSGAKIAEFIAKHYEDVDRNLFLTGILLHDIGKITELSGPGDTEYTDEGNFIGHIVIGRDIVKKAMEEMVDFPRELQWKIEHMILAHQGKLEWGSPKKPAFLEAFLVHFIDEMDARVNQIQASIENDIQQGNWTSLQNYFRTALWKKD